MGRLLKSLTLLAFCAFASIANAQTYTGLTWGLDRTSNPYNVGINLNGVWYNFGKITSTGTSLLSNHVATNAALAATPTSYYPNGVWRDDYAANAGAGPLWFTPLTGNCAANSLVNDGGNCVDASGGNSWKAHYINVINIAQFGVDLTGTSDISAILNGLFTTIAASGKQWTIKFPCGSYLIQSAPAVLLASNVTLEGESSTCVRIINGQTNAPAIQLGNNITNYFNNKVKGFNFVGKSGVVGVAGQVGLVTYRQNLFKMEDLYSNAFPAALYDVFYMEKNNQFFGLNIVAQGALHNGITCFDAGGWHAEGVLSQSNANNGFEFRSCQGIYGINFTTYNNGNYGFAFLNGAITPTNNDGSNRNNFFVNPVGDTSGVDNFYIENLSNSMLSNVWAATQISAGGTATGRGITMITNKVWGVRISNLTSIFNNSDGLALLDGGGSTGAPFDITITNPHIGSQSPRSRPNGRGTSGGYGIVATGAASAKIIGGSVPNNVTGAISVNATANIVFDGVEWPGTTVASLPACNAGLFGSRNMYVTDGLAGLTVGANLQAGGTTKYYAECQGSSWVIGFGPHSPYTTAHTWSGVQIFNSGVKLTGVSIASLGTCDGTTIGTLKWVDDTVSSGAPTFHATVAGGGATTVHSLASCDGTNWVWD